MGQNCAKQKSPKKEEDIPDKVKDDLDVLEDSPMVIDVKLLEDA